jgi:hypothetical protein
MDKAAGYSKGICNLAHGSAFSAQASHSQDIHTDSRTP